MKPLKPILLGLAAWGLGALHLCGEIPANALSDGSVYEVKGVLQNVDVEHRQATIAHGEIPGYMPAMTMSFDVHDPAILPTLHPGDPLSFRLCVTATSAWIEQLHKTAGAAAPAFVPAAPTPSPELTIGDLLPDLDLVTSAGQTVHLRDFRGQPLAITFIYARCPLPTYCPLLNRNFQTAQTLLARMSSTDHWQFLSISLDAAHDGPEVLANIASVYGADAQHWTFVTAPEEKVRELGRAVGLAFSTSGGQISHNLRTVVLDPTGRIRQIYRGNSWTPQELVAAMRAAMPLRQPEPKS